MPSKKQYRALTGFDYPDGLSELDKAKKGKPHASVRVEAGDVVDEPPAAILASWLSNGIVEECEPGARPVRVPADVGSESEEGD